MLRKLKAMPFKARVAFKRMETVNFTHERLHSSFASLNGTLSVPQKEKYKKVWIRKELEERIVNETQVKSQVAMNVDQMKKIQVLMANTASRTS